MSGAPRAQEAAQDADLAEQRALKYLAKEVPQWSVENRCFSCHNNGDAARALYRASRAGLDVPAEALFDTTEWLKEPDGWDDNRGDPEFSDKGLARIQFAAALVEALQAGRIEERGKLAEAARLVVEYQQPDGSWQVDAPGSIGSPATYGSLLATAVSLNTLRQAGAEQFKKEIEAAENWLLNIRPQNVVASAGVILGLAETPGPAAGTSIQKCLELLRSTQAADGGWGPYAGSPPETFDTALVLLALDRLSMTRASESPADLVALVRRGREYLIANQLEEGSWQETMRPRGGESYAQRLSTTGWAAQALLATRHK